MSVGVGTSVEVGEVGEGGTVVFVGAFVGVLVGTDVGLLTTNETTRVAPNILPFESASRQ